MKCIFHNVAIRSIIGGTGSEQYNASELVAPFVGQDQAERLVRSLGFKKLRAIPRPHTCGDLATDAALDLFKKENLTGNDFDACISVTQSPNYIVPANTFYYQEKLGLNKDCLFMDVIQGCAGYIYGIMQAAILIESKRIKRVLLLTGDTSSIAANLITAGLNGRTNVQVSNAAIFGDGASATILEFSEDTQPITCNIENFGKFHTVLEDDFCKAIPLRPLDIDSFKPNFLHIDGTELARFSMNEVRDNIKQTMELAEVTCDKLSYCISHQANRPMLKSLARSLQVPAEFIPFLSENTGNTSSASIPLAISENVSQLDKLKTAPTLMTGFGVGLCAGSAIVDLRKCNIYEPVYL